MSRRAYGHHRSGSARSQDDHKPLVKLTPGDIETITRRCSMGLPVRQRRALDHIDRALRGSDPRLAALYAIFDRLAQPDPIPRFEQLRSGLVARVAKLGAVLAAICAHLHIRVGVRRRAQVKTPSRVRPPSRVRTHSPVRTHSRVRTQSRARTRIRRGLWLRPRQRAVLLYPLAIALAIGSIVLAARSGPDRGCLPVRAVAAAKNVAKSSLCQQGTLSPVTYGH